MRTRATWLAMSVFIAGCARSSRQGPDIAPEILSEVTRIRAIDNHAHPMRFVSGAEEDREFDALPVDNSQRAAKNSDRKAFFADEEAVRRQFLQDAGLDAPPQSLDEYLRVVVTSTLERQKQGGAIAEKFEAAYLRSLRFDKVDR